MTPTNNPLLENDKAIDFVLQIDENSQVSLADFKDKYLILYFYPKDDTPGCTIEAIDFRKLEDRFLENNAIILGVSPDDLKSHHKFKEKHCLPFALGYDRDHKVSISYNCWVEKSMFGKKHMGVERSTFLIDPQGIIRKIWRKVSITNHAHEVLANLISLNKNSKK
jgi:thioredoxin-dependent peroxiredoxin